MIATKRWIYLMSHWHRFTRESLVLKPDYHGFKSSFAEEKIAWVQILAIREFHQIFATAIAIKF